MTDSSFPILATVRNKMKIDTRGFKGQYLPDISNKISVPKQDRDGGLIKLDRMIEDAKGILLVYPGWWNNMPGILKCFFDRVEFKTSPRGAPIKTWDGKKAFIITGGGAPFFVRKFLFRNQAFNSVKYVFKSLGTKVSFKLICDGIPTASDKQKETWMKRAKITGEKFGKSLM